MIDLIKYQMTELSRNIFMIARILMIEFLQQKNEPPVKGSLHQ
jgi:hypothetical protein